MSGYLIVNYRVTNAEGFKAYTNAVAPTIFTHGGKILVAEPGSEPFCPTDWITPKVLP